jgi:hypothetical protein
MHGNAKKTLDDNLAFQTIVFFFFVDMFQQRFLKKTYIFWSWNGHGSHITIQAFKQITKLGLDMVTLLSHALDVLQPLNVTYFKPFKNVFKKKKKQQW